jgi:5-methylcytosine-specific restriction endonuclease McrA
MATVRGNPIAWENFYKTARWRRLRKFQLMQHPLCKFCLERGIVTPANVIDHVVPHKGDWTKFVNGKNYRACTSRAIGRRSGRSSCAVIAATSVSTAFRLIPITRSIVLADLVA